MLVSSALSHLPQSRQPLLVLQSSLAQSSLPLLRHLLESSTKNEKCHTLLFSFLYPPSALCDISSINLTVADFTHRIPGYDNQSGDLHEQIFQALENVPSSPLNVVFDSVDTLVSNHDTISEVYRLISQVLERLRSRKGASRLVLHILAPCPLLPYLSQTSLSSTLTSIIAHPPALFVHLATAYSIPPPPISPQVKFWNVFIPLSLRLYESEELIYGADGEGSNDTEELVVEVLVRGGADASGRRRPVERVLEGFMAGSGFCEVLQLRSLKDLGSKLPTKQTGADPTHNLPFNLNLTEAQQESRSQVALPYAHQGKSFENQSKTSSGAAIFYDPDSADDLDDDDPDEDLDI